MPGTSLDFCWATHCYTSIFFLSGAGAEVVWFADDIDKDDSYGFGVGGAASDDEEDHWLSPYLDTSLTNNQFAIDWIVNIYFL